MADSDYNSQYIQDQTARATAAANDAYNRGMLELGNKELALKQAQQVWKESMDKSGLTGMYEGQYTMPTQQNFAQMFGTWGAPTQGQQTLAGQAQQFGQGATLASMYGQYYAPGEAPSTGMQTQAAQEQQYTQGLRNQQQALAEQAQQQKTANEYLTLLSNLRGPADWAKYQQVLGSTPGGMRDLVGAAMGQYVPGGGATTGYQPQAANLQTMYADTQGYGQQGYGGLNANQFQYQAPGAAGGPQQGYAVGQTQPYAQNQQYNAAGQVQAPAQWGTANTAQIGQQREAAGNGTNMMGAQQPGAPQANQMNLPAPNQIAAQSWKNMAPSQQQMLLGEYESQGWHKPDVEALMNQSLPKYAANAPGAGTWRLR